MHSHSALLSIMCSMALLALLPIATGAHAASDAVDRRQLQIQQQQDAINLNLQQSIRSRRYDLSPSDERRLDQLQLDQRLQQQLLEQQQQQRAYQLRQDPSAPPSPALDARSAAQRELFSQERQLQMQRFDMEQQQLLNSARPFPLQPPPAAGQLSPP